MKKKDIDTQVLDPKDKLQLIRDKVFKNLVTAHEKGAKVYNTKSKSVAFKPGQIVYRHSSRHSYKADSYNAKLSPKNIKCMVLKAIENAIYEL